MTGNAGALSAEPVVNPGVRAARARRLFRMAANNDKYLDLVARTVADQRATLAAEALSLPEPR